MCGRLWLLYDVHAYVHLSCFFPDKACSLAACQNPLLSFLLFRFERCAKISPLLPSGGRSSPCKHCRRYGLFTSQPDPCWFSADAENALALLFLWTTNGFLLFFEFLFHTRLLSRSSCSYSPTPTCAPSTLSGSPSSRGTSSLLAGSEGWTFSDFHQQENWELATSW